MKLALCILAALASFAHAAPILEVVTDFEHPASAPLAPLVLAADGNFYGTTSAGGRNDLGTIFRMTTSGTLTVLHHFDGTDGAAPLAGLNEGTDGALYGTASEQGTNALGTVFKMTTAGAFTTLVHFTGTTGNAKGAVPAGELYLGGDGNFYGTTEAGGAGDFGTIFRMTPAGTLTTLREFTGTSGAVKGAQPRGRLAADVAGTTLFGSAAAGGANDAGVVFKVTTAGTFTLLKEFTGTSGNTKGSLPAGGLIRCSDGNYYGVTEAGGNDNLGTIFKTTSAGSFTTLHHGAVADGGSPGGTLYQAADGLLYGTTANGGIEDTGVVFKMTTGGAYTVIAEFTGTDGLIKGAESRAALTPAGDGSLIGCTSAGGAGNRGTLFQVTTAGVFATLAECNNAGGWMPSGGLTPVADGLIVTLTEGGANGVGALAKIATSGVITTLASFTGTTGVTRGAEPVGGLAASVSGDLYGVTRRGGSSDGGSAFRLSAAGAFTSLTSFGSANGQFPEGGLVHGGDGLFYGTGFEGGASGLGTVFKMTEAGARTLLVSFTGVAGAAPGARPSASLVAGEADSFFGTTAEGGASGLGTIFRVTSGGVFTPLVEFSGANGATPLGALVRSVDGSFYGTTSKGGASGLGTLFRMTPDGILSTLISFSGINGSVPVGGLLAAPDGVLYGTTATGGTHGLGTMFRTSASGVFSTLFSFSGANGAGGPGALVFGPDGALYGASPDFGLRGGGALYRVRQLGPHAGTGLASALSSKGGTFNASVITGGEATTFSFEYGTTPALGSETTSVILPASPSPAAPLYSATGFVPGQTVYFRAKAGNASGVSLGVIQSFTVPAAFAAWKLAATGDANAADLSDTDGDGLTLLHEYALCLSPQSPDIAPGAEIREYAEGARLSMTFIRDPQRDDITIAVQASDAPAGPWLTIASSVNGGPVTGDGYVSGETPNGGPKSIEVRDVINLADAPQRFLRLHLTH